MSAPKQHGDARFERLHAWIVDNLRGDLSVASLADAVSMSERSFVRHYLRTTGMTPARAIERIRVEAARQALEQGLSVKRVAARCGFGSEGCSARYWRAARTVLHPEIKPTHSFTGRASELRKISNALQSGHTAAISQPAAVHGLGGIGKSTLARDA